MAFDQKMADQNKAMYKEEEHGDQKEKGEQGISLVKMKKLMVEHFSPDDMKSIAFDLRIDSSGFNSKRESFAQDLLESADNRGLLAQLLNALQEDRPKVIWNVYEEEYGES